MAKSLRSKWKRKMRAIKRERYGEKELARLKKVLGIEDGEDIEMKNIENIATVVDAKSIQANTEDIPEEKGIEEEEEEEEEENEAEKEVMEIDEVKQSYSKRTLRNEHGNYPVWMSKREVKKRSIGNRKRKQKVKRKRIQDKQKRKKN
ncbi:protein LLP homolog isoform X2 [Cryptotermes secundus]|nr:protein LLP homolog isoform X2 [Cryptotermes secundus]XP_023712004.1 protein LLP homolog isoform X2 [Cryptotermes secundus]XP_023712008.1 protein LLP homolog isoform X2 [Cryptotermes secundus]